MSRKVFTAANGERVVKIETPEDGVGYFPENMPDAVIEGFLKKIAAREARTAAKAKPSTTAAKRNSRV